MGLIERFRRPKPHIEAQISESLTLQVTEKLLDDLKSGYKFEYRNPIYNNEELDELFESGEDDREDAEESKIDDGIDRPLSIREGMIVVLKGNNKYYEVEVWRRDPAISKESGLEAREYSRENKLSTNFHDMTDWEKEVIFGKGTFVSLIGSSWRTEDSYSWSSKVATSEQTLSLFKALMKAKVDPEATLRAFQRDMLREERYKFNKFAKFTPPGEV